MSTPQTTREDANLTLVKAMGSKRGYDPMPPDQYEWQAAKGEPPLLRLWSWMCAHTIAFGKRSAFAVREDGRIARLADAAKDLELSIQVISDVWAFGARKGLWHRDEGTPGLYLNGRVTAGQIEWANKERTKLLCTNLSRPELAEIKGWPKERQEAFWGLWKPALAYRSRYEAALIAEAREACDELEDNIRRQFALKKTRLPKRRAPAPDLPQILLPFCVQRTSAGPSAAVRTNGENAGENASVQTAASLLPSKTEKRAVKSVGQSSRGSRAETNEVPAGTSLPAANGSAPSHPTKTLSKMAGEHAQVHAALITELSGRLPGETPSPALCAQIDQRLRGAPLAHLVNRIQARAEKIRSYGMCGTLADEVGQAWLAGKAARDRAAIANKELEARRHARAIEEARRTLDDSRADEQEKQLAREILGIATRTAKGGS